MARRPPGPSGGVPPAALTRLTPSTLAEPPILLAQRQQPPAGFPSHDLLVYLGVAAVASAIVFAALAVSKRRRMWKGGNERADT